MLLAIEAKAEGVADSGNHSGYKGSSAHLAGERFVCGVVFRGRVRGEKNVA